MGAKSGVLEFCDRLRAVCERLTEEQCRALQDTGTLGALHAAILAVRAGQVVRNVPVERLKGIAGDALKSALGDVVRRVTQEGDERGARR